MPPPSKYPTNALYTVKMIYFDAQEHLKFTVYRQYDPDLCKKEKNKKNNNERVQLYFLLHSYLFSPDMTRDWMMLTTSNVFDSLEVFLDHFNNVITFHFLINPVF